MLVRIRSLRWVSRQLLLSSAVVWVGCGDEATTLGTPAVSRHQGIAAPGTVEEDVQAPVDAPANPNNPVLTAEDLESLIVEKPAEPTPSSPAPPPAADPGPSQSPVTTPSPAMAPQPDPEPSPAAPQPSPPAPGGFFGGFGAPPPTPTPEPGAGTPTPSPSPTESCRPLAVSLSSGDIGTGAACFTVPAPLQGWQVSNLGNRTLTVNGQNVMPPALPSAEGNGYTFSFSAGEPSYTAFSTW